MSLRAALICSGLALGLATPPSAAAQPASAEVIHFWVSGGESAAIRVLADAYQKSGGRWIDTAVAGGDAARSLTLSRMQGGDPPTAMMWTIGTAVGELAGEGLLADIDAVAVAGGWADRLPPLVVERARVDGRWFAAPLNIHGENWLFASQTALAAIGTTMPATWDAFFIAADKAKAAGYIPLALGGEPWQEVLLLRAIVASEGGPALYRRTFVERDGAALRSPEFAKAVQIFDRLRGYVDPGSPGRSWNDATNLVITDKAAFQVMGDWAKGEFLAAGEAAGRDYACTLPPGQDRGYIIAVDVFAFPRTERADQVEAQRQLASVLMDKEVQVAFNAAKGSVPVRNDVVATDFDACGKLALEVLADPANHLPNASLAMTDDMEGGVEDVVTRFWNDPAADPQSLVDDLVQVIAGS